MWHVEFGGSVFELRNCLFCTVLEEVGRVRFEHCKACRRIGESVLITIKHVEGF